MSGELPGALALRLHSVCCRYGRSRAVDDVDLRVEPGQRVALTGTNGSGKSTLLRAVLGLHRDVSGDIEVGGRIARRAADWAVRRRQIAWIPQQRAAGRFPLPADEPTAALDFAGQEQVAALPGTVPVTIVNFPDQNLDLLSVYRAGVRSLTTALTG